MLDLLHRPADHLTSDQSGRFHILRVRFQNHLMKYLAATTVIVFVLLLLALANTIIPMIVRNALQVLP